MTTVTLRIAVDKSGASENIGAVKKDLKDMGTAGREGGQQASQGVNSLSSALGSARAAVAGFVAAYAAIQTLSGVVRLADEYQNLTGQLGLVTRSTEEFATAQAGVFEIAQQTGSALGSVNSLYVSLARSTQELNLSQGQLLTITDAVSQSFVVSNASAADADNAIRQLGQAFASGVLRGDEFNSMSENAPRLQDALAKSLGVTRGELRAMAADGQLTSDVLARGLLEQAPAIASEFDQMGLTVGRAFTQLSNSVLKFVGEASESTGAARALAAVISGLATALPGVAIGITGLAVAFGTLKLAAIAASTATFTMAGAFAAASAALGVLAVGVLAFKLGEYLADEFRIAREAGAYLVISMNAVWEAIKTGAAAGATFLRVAFVTVIDAIQEKIAGLLEAFVQLAQFEIFGQSVDFTFLQADALTALAGSLRESTDAAGETDAAMAELRAKMDASTQATQDLESGLFDAIDAHFETKDAAGEAAKGIALIAPAAKLSKEELKKLADQQESARRASDALTKEQERLTAEVGGPAVAAYIELAQRLRAVDEIEVQLRADQGLSREESARLTSVREGLARSLIANVSALNAAETAEQQYLRELREDLRLSGLSGIARQQAVIRIDAEAAARRLLKGATEEQIQAYADEIVVIKDQTLAAEASTRAAEDWELYWSDALGAVNDVFADVLSGNIDNLEDFGDQVLQISKRIVSDMIKEFARTGQIRLPTGSDGTTAGNIGAGIQGLGFAYAGYQNAQAGGNPLATVGSFTLAGAQFGSMILPGIGTAIGAAVGAVVGALASAFGGPGDPLLRVRSNEFGGPRRSEGQATSALGNIFIRTENTPDGAGTSPEIAQAIAGFDNLIAGFLNEEQLAVVRSALENVNDTFRDGAFTLENAVGSRFDTILGALSSDIQAFVGSTGTLEDRMNRLADAVFIAAAAADGAISSDFGEIAELLSGFRVGSENLADTFARLSAGLSQVDGALLILGGTFSGTRLQAATFAGDLIDIAGGLDAFSQKLNGALDALFNDEERNQFLAAQSQLALNSALSEIGISGVGIDNIREQLRNALRTALEAGNAELVNQILTAANALGAFGSAVEALGEDAVEAASTTAFGGATGGGSTAGGSAALTAGGELVSAAGVAAGAASTALEAGGQLISAAGTAANAAGELLTAGGSLISAAGTATGATGAGTPPVAVTQLETTQQANIYLERQTGLLETIADNTRPQANPEAAKSARDTSDASRKAAESLSRIEALIAEAVRSQVQAALKSLRTSSKATA